jgi:hypothetical protein
MEISDLTTYQQIQKEKQEKRPNPNRQRKDLREF